MKEGSESTPLDSAKLSLKYTSSSLILLLETTLPFGSRFIASIGNLEHWSHKYIEESVQNLIEDVEGHLIVTQISEISDEPLQLRQNLFGVVGWQVSSRLHC